MKYMSAPNSKVMFELISVYPIISFLFFLVIKEAILFNVIDSHLILVIK